MKRLPQITSVESKLRFLNTELQRVIDSHSKTRKLWKRKGEATLQATIDGYETFNSCSVNIPLQGTVEIFFSNFNEKAPTLISVLTRTRFLITCIRSGNGNYFPVMEASLS